MAIIGWKESFSVGVEHLDKQHMGLVNLINTLHDAMILGKAKSALDEIINELIKYSLSHFKSEEILFTQFKYPEAEDHIAEHKKFAENIAKFKRDYDNGRLMLSYEVMDFLKNWLLTHILGTDMQYKSFLNSKGVH